MADLNADEVTMARLVFDIYDEAGSGKIDCADLGNALRCLKLNPTQAAVTKAGGTEKKGEKGLTIEEFLPVYSQMKKDKDVGTLEDLLEGIKVYDKMENGTIMLAELAHVLLSLGERLTNAEVDQALKFAGTEDEDGFIKYDPWLRQLFAGPPEDAKAE